jgi:glycine cleavage system aminomethyltransferase T
MSVVHPLGRTEPLDEVLRAAGAVMAMRRGTRVAVHYGSPAGELAVCARAVGLVDRSELSLLSLTAAADRLTEVVARSTGATVAAGGSAYAGGAWWCRIAPGEVLVVSAPLVAARLRDRVRTEACRAAGLGLHDVSGDYAPIGLVGRATPAVLSALGVYGPRGDPHEVAPVGWRSVAGVRVLWLLEGDRRALAFAPRAAAGVVWRTIEQSGRPFGLSCVGRDALDRFALLDQAGHRETTAPLV